MIDKFNLRIRLCLLHPYLVHLPHFDSYFIDLGSIFSRLFLVPAIPVTLAQFFNCLAPLGRLDQRRLGGIDLPLNVGQPLHEQLAFALHGRGKTPVSGQISHIEPANQAINAKVVGLLLKRLIESAELRLQLLPLPLNDGQVALFLAFNVSPLAENAVELENKSRHKL